MDQKSAVAGRRLLWIGRHPRPPLLSAYLDGDLVGRRRVSIERHLRRCHQCHQLLASLEVTVASLVALREPPADIADAVVAVWQAQASDQANATPRRQARHAVRLHLRLTLSLAVLAGVAFSLINQGSALTSGEIDLRMCIMCGANFVVPFLALNVGLFLFARAPGRFGESFRAPSSSNRR